MDERTTEKVAAIRERTFEILRQRAMITLSNELLVSDVKIEQAADLLAHDLWAAYLSINIAGKAHEVGEVSYPATWWDAVKQRWFPRLEYRLVHVVRTTYHTCPHLPIPTCHRDSHMLWLESVGKVGFNENEI